MIINVIDETLKMLLDPTENDETEWKIISVGYETEYQNMKLKIDMDPFWERIFCVDEIRMHNFDKKLHKVLYKAIRQNVKRAWLRAKEIKEEKKAKEKKLAKEKEEKEEKENKEKVLRKLQALHKQGVLNRSDQRRTQ